MSTPMETPPKKRSVGIGRSLDFAEVALMRADMMLEKWFKGLLQEPIKNLNNHCAFIEDKLTSLRSKLLTGDERSVLAKIYDKIGEMKTAVAATNVHVDMKQNRQEQAVSGMLALSAGESGLKLNVIKMPLPMFKDRCRNHSLVWLFLLLSSLMLFLLLLSFAVAVDAVVVFIVVIVLAAFGVDMAFHSRT